MYLAAEFWINCKGLIELVGTEPILPIHRIHKLRTAPKTPGAPLLSKII